MVASSDVTRWPRDFWSNFEQKRAKVHDGLSSTQADAIGVLREHGVDPRRVCVHCFTGNLPELELVRAFGARVGFTGFVGVAKRAEIKASMWLQCASI